MPEITAWAITTGEDGMRTQARGLAEAVATRVIEKTAPARWSWGRRGEKPDRFEAPWPDVLITCGRRSTTLSRVLRKASGGKMLTVHIQDPRVSPASFDLVVAMAHDSIAARPNVIKVATALHDLTAAKLAAAAELWCGRLEALERPLVGVAIGGSIRGGAFTPLHGRELIGGLQRLRREAGASLAITPSRRTPPAIRALLNEAFGNDERVFLWDMAGENPYRGILALSDRLVVTSDSVSMVSEALATSHPVEVFDLGFARHAGFLEGLIERRLVRRFKGEPIAPPAGGPVNTTTEAALAVQGLLQARTGVVG